MNKLDIEVIEEFDTGKYDEIVKAYCRAAMDSCGVKNEKVEEVISQLNFLLDNFATESIIKMWRQELE